MFALLAVPEDFRYTCAPSNGCIHVVLIFEFERQAPCMLYFQSNIKSSLNIPFLKDSP